LIEIIPLALRSHNYLSNLFSISARFSVPVPCQIGLKWFLFFSCLSSLIMDSFDRRILNVLQESKPLDFAQPLKAVGFSHNTLRSRLAGLERQGMIVKTNNFRKGPGRAVLVYTPPREIKRRVSLTLTNPSTTKKEEPDVRPKTALKS